MKLNFMKECKMAVLLILTGTGLLLSSVAMPKAGQAENDKLPIIIVNVDDTPLGEEIVIPGDVEEINLSAEASIEASSSFPGMPPTNVLDGDPSTEWASYGDKPDKTPWVQLNWYTPKIVKSVTLQDRPNPVDHITGGQLLFSDGSSVQVGQLPNDGSPLLVTFPEKTVTWLKLQVTSVSPETQNPGLKEILVIGLVKSPDQVIPPESIYSQIKNDLIKFAKVIAKDTPALVMIHPVKEDTSVEALRNYFKKYYGDIGSMPEEGDIVVDYNGVVVAPGVVKGLEGAILVGDAENLPIYKYNNDLPEYTYISDYFLMDLNEDTTAPEIYVSRILGDVNIIQEFIFRDLTYRNEAKSALYSNGKACIYTGWPYAHIMTPGIYHLYNKDKIDEYRYYYPSPTGIEITDVDESTVFLEYIWSQYEPKTLVGVEKVKYDWLDVVIGGNATKMEFIRRGKPSGDLTIQELKDELSQIRFLVLRGAEFGNFMEDNYIAGVTFSNGSNLIATIASTNPSIPLMDVTDISYDPLYTFASDEDKTLGDAFMALCKSNQRDWSGSTGHIFTGVSYVFLGDPTIRMSSILKADNKGSLDNVKEYVAKGICGGEGVDIKPCDITYKAYGSKWMQIGFTFLYLDSSAISIYESEDGDIHKESFSPGPKEISYRVTLYGINGIFSKGPKVFVGKVTLNGQYKGVNLAYLIPINSNSKLLNINVKLDYDNKIAEFDENNNSRAQDVNNKNILDLFIAGMDIINKDSFFSYSTSNVWANVRNWFTIEIKNSGVIGGSEVLQLKQVLSQVDEIPIQVEVLGPITGESDIFLYKKGYITFAQEGSVDYDYTIYNKDNFIQDIYEGRIYRHAFYLSPYKLFEEFPFLGDYPKDTMFGFISTLDPNNKLPYSDTPSNNSKSKALDLP